MLHAVAAVFIW